MRAIGRFAVVVWMVILAFFHDICVKLLLRQGLIIPSVYLPDGTLIHIAASYGSSKTMSAVSNANPGVATLEASHGVVQGDILEVTSNWSRLNKRVVRAGTVSTNDVALEGINTSSTTLFPAGSGTGTVREISSWTQLQQVTSLEGEGGEQQFVTYRFLEDDAERRIPTAKSAAGSRLTIGDDDTLAGQILAETANNDRTPRGIRFTKANGGLIYTSAYITLSPMPRLTFGEIGQLEVTLSFENPQPTKYAS